MKRAALLMLTNLLLTSLMVSCGSATTANGSRPVFKPPAGESGEADVVKFDPVPTGKPVYLGLLDSGGTLRLPTQVNEGATSAPLNVNAIKAILSDVPRVAASSLVPGSALSDPAPVIKGGDARVAVLSPVMFQDANANGRLDPGETLPRMTHDLLLYADKPFELSYTTGAPEMRHTWNIVGATLTRAEHYVYKPLTENAYLRSMTSAPLVFELHVPTPETSQ